METQDAGQDGDRRAGKAKGEGVFKNERVPHRENAAEIHCQQDEDLGDTRDLLVGVSICGRHPTAIPLVFPTVGHSKAVLWQHSGLAKGPPFLAGPADRKGQG